MSESVHKQLFNYNFSTASPVILNLPQNQVLKKHILPDCRI